MASAKWTRHWVQDARDRLTTNQGCTHNPYLFQRPANVDWAMIMNFHMDFGCTENGYRVSCTTIVMIIIFSLGKE
jgi:hypothetical protein